MLDETVEVGTPEASLTPTSPGVRHVAEVYGGARHGYAVPDTAAHDEAAAERHYGELAALLGRTVG